MNDNYLIELHRIQKKEAENLKSVRFDQWKENVDLYKDKVKRNLLTQRVNANIPIIRESIRSWISGIDEPPEIVFLDRGKDPQKQLYFNELWKKFVADNNLDVLDQLDKKNAGLFGRTFKIIYWDKNKNFPSIDLISPFDILVPPDANSVDISKIRYIKHINNVIPLDEILNNENYKKDVLNKIKIDFAVKGGQISEYPQMNDLSFTAKEQLLEETASNLQNQTFASKRVKVDYSYDLVFENGRFIRKVRVYVNDQWLIYDDLAEKFLGIDDLTISTWAYDPDQFIFWSNGIADVVRPINKVVNKYFSQDIENRTLRNLGMYFYNNMKGNFIPKGFKPIPFGMFGMPGNPREMVMQVDIQPLADNANQIEYLKNLAQSSVAQTPTRRGVEDGQRTLGEVQIDLTQSTKITLLDTKQYRNSWLEIANAFIKLIEKNLKQPVVLEKENKKGFIEEKEITPEMWKSKKGYKAKLIFKSDKDKDDNLQIQKMQYVINNFVDNPVALEIARKKQLEALGFDQTEIQDIINYTKLQTQTNLNPEQNNFVDNQIYSMEKGGVEGLNQKQNEYPTQIPQ